MPAITRRYDPTGHLEEPQPAAAAVGLLDAGNAAFAGLELESVDAVGCR